MILIIAICTLIWLLYLFGTRKFDYWEKRGVKYDKPNLPFIGSIIRVATRQLSVTQYATELYQKYPDEKFVGCFAGVNCLIMRDPELIKHVLVTDFNSFYPRALNTHKTVIEPLLKNLFFADGDLWKLLRQRMTPAFTSGKLKAMFPLIIERTKRLQKSVAVIAARGEEIDVRNLMARYTTDFIGACGFGIDVDSLNEGTSEFFKLGKQIFNIRMREFVISTLKWVFPELFKRLHVLSPEVENTTFSLVKGIIKERNYKDSGRNDFIDLLFKLKAKGVMVGESIEKREVDGSPKMVRLELDELLMAAQVFVFLAAGFETSSSATSYTLHQLAFHPEVQKRCQEEIDEVLSRYDNKLCYEAVNEMKYLDMCFREGMRMFPSLGYLMRQSTRPYTFPGTKVTIDEGVYIFIPVQALHNDPKYFENPERFVPERFSSEHAKNITKYVYLPFGEGPRACIGERLGLMQSLAGLAALLSRFSVAPSKNTLRHPISDPSAMIVQNIKGGLPLMLTERKRQ